MIDIPIEDVIPQPEPTNHLEDNPLGDLFGNDKDGDYVEELNIPGRNFDCPNVDSEGDCSDLEVHKEGPEDHPDLGESNDWRKLFKSNSSLGKLDYIDPRKSGNTVLVSLPDLAVDEGVDTWKTSLVGQFLDKSLPFFLVKKICGPYAETI